MIVAVAAAEVLRNFLRVVVTGIPVVGCLGIRFSQYLNKVLPIKGSAYKGFAQGRSGRGNRLPIHRKNPIVPCQRKLIDLGRDSRIIASLLGVDAFGVLDAWNLELVAPGANLHSEGVIVGCGCFQATLREIFLVDLDTFHGRGR